MAIPQINEINRARGLYQIVHDFEFVALNLGRGYTEIRDMSHEEKYSYFCGRLKKLKDRSYGGVVLNTGFKCYLEDEENLALCARTAEYAKSIGLSVWIYDEQYYPSGSAGGFTLKDHPELQALGLVEVEKQRTTDGRTPIRVASPYGHSELKYAIAVPIKNDEYDYDHVLDISDKKDLSGGLCAYLPTGEWCVKCYFYRTVFDHTTLAQALRTSRRAVNIFDARTMDRFFDVTFKNGYMKHFKEKLGNTVDAVFTDEPSYPEYSYHTSHAKEGMKFLSHLKTKAGIITYSVRDEEDIDLVIYPYIIWAEDLPLRYAEAYEEDLIPLLPHLFNKTEKSVATRVKFYTLLSKMAGEGFVAQYHDRLQNEGVKLSGHYLYEERPDHHPIFFGDIIDHLSRFSIPGCDNLRSNPEALRYGTACKIASSAAHLTNKELVMIEASNMLDQDQDITLEKMKGALSMMFAHGVNLITSYYGEDILSPEQMAEFADYAAKLSSLFDGGKYKIDTLLYYPYEQICGFTEPFRKDFCRDFDTLALNECAKILMQSQIGFDIINKGFLLRSKIEDGALLLENGQTVKRLVLPRISWADRELAEFLEKANRHGLDILKLDGDPIEGIQFTPKKLAPTLLHTKELMLAAADPYILTMHREFSDYDIFMLVNSSEEKATNAVKIFDSGNDYAFVDLNSYSLVPTDPITKEGYAEFDLSFAPLEAKLIMRYRK